MISDFWSQLIEMLLKGSKFNSRYFINEILVKIAQFHQEFNGQSNKRKLVVRMDNVRPHRSNDSVSFAAKNNFRFCDHPAFSPDLAPSDFYLFGKVKDELKGSEFEYEEELFESIENILKKIPKEELESVMKEWENRLKACISCGGDYID